MRRNRSSDIPFAWYWEGKPLRAGRVVGERIEKVPTSSSSVQGSSFPSSNCYSRPASLPPSDDSMSTYGNPGSLDGYSCPRSHESLSQDTHERCSRHDACYPRSETKHCSYSNGSSHTYAARSDCQHHTPESRVSNSTILCQSHIHPQGLPCPCPYIHGYPVHVHVYSYPVSPRPNPPCTCSSSRASQPEPPLKVKPHSNRRSSSVQKPRPDVDYNDRVAEWANIYPCHIGQRHHHVPYHTPRGENQGTEYVTAVEHSSDDGRGTDIENRSYHRRRPVWKNCFHTTYHNPIY